MRASISPLKEYFWVDELYLALHRCTGMEKHKVSSPQSAFIQQANFKQLNVLIPLPPFLCPHTASIVMTTAKYISF